MDGTRTLGGGGRMVWCTGECAAGRFLLRALTTWLAGASGQVPESWRAAPHVSPTTIWERHGRLTSGNALYMLVRGDVAQPAVEGLGADVAGEDIQPDRRCAGLDRQWFHGFERPIGVAHSTVLRLDLEVVDVGAT